jgi:LuxR family maltose regulon positive regulatory protein
MIDVNAQDRYGARIGWIRRDALLSALRRHDACRIVTIVAPAGFGKSTTMLQWLDDLRTRGTKPVWFALEAVDNDENAFLTRFVGALSRELEEPGELQLALRSSPVTELPVLLDATVAALAAEAQPVAIFFDDHHLLVSAPVLRFIEELTQRAPQGVRFILGSRSQPELKLARLRVLGDIFELGPDDLRFAAEEAHAFFDSKLDAPVGPEVAATLCERAEGWIAALQLASLSIGRRNPAAVIESFSGANRNVADFLMGEVFADLPAELAQFMLATAMLEKFSAEACKGIFKAERADRLIAEIEARNLFLVPLDEERRWYRYHHMFRDFLQREAERQAPETMRARHLAAAEWFCEHHMLAEAIRHALEVGDTGRAASFVEANALTLIAQCQLLYVRQLLALLPPVVIERRIRLQLIVLWLAVHSSQPDIATRTLEAARRLAQVGPTEPSDPGTLPGTSIEVELMVLEAAVHSTLERFEPARDAALAALRAIAPDAWFMEGAAENIVGYNLYALGDLEGARRALTAARRAHERSGSLLGVTIAACYLAVVERAAGKLGMAETILRDAVAEARQRAGVNSYPEALAGSLLAELAYETGRCDEALALVERLGPQIEGAAVILYPLASVPTYARLMQYYGRSGHALDILHRVYANAERGVYRRLSSTLVFECTRLLIGEGRVAEARAFLDRHRAQPCQDGPPGEFEVMATARVLTAERAFDKAAATLRPVIERTRTQGRVRRHLLALLLLARNAALANRPVEADETLVQALQEGLAGGFLRCYLDEDVTDRLGRLAGTLAKSRPDLAAYASRIVRAAASSASAKPPSKPEAARREKLTQRENELLALVSDGLSNREIAAALSVSEATIKWHLKNIFGKLSVANRVQAARMARSELPHHR